MHTLLPLTLALFAGLMMSRVTKKFNLPAVTAYLIAGIIIGPFCIGALGIDNLGFNSLHEVENYKLLSEVALGFIAFTMGNEFRVTTLKKVGRQAVVIAVFQAIVATLFVDVTLYGLHLLLGEDKLPLSAVLTLGAIATATAPAATLMVVKQYKAKGPVTSMLLPVVALDDMVGLVVFAISFGIAKSIDLHHLDILSIVVDPILEVVASLALGAVLGLVFHYIEQFFHSRSKRLSISVMFVFLAVALSELTFTFGKVTLAFSSLLVCMAMGTVFCNLCSFSEELMDRIDRWTGPLMVLFFVLSGCDLNFKVFGNWAIILVGVVYIIFRSVGKIYGAKMSASFMHCEPNIKKYLGITLLPQAGVCLGMSLTAMEQLGGASGLIIRNVSLFAVLIYELVGPLLTRIALQKAGEITERPITEREKAKLEAKQNA